MNYKLVAGLFDRWYIVHPTDNTLAWSGSKWVSACGSVQICNFLSQEAARTYAERNLHGEPKKAALDGEPK
jgi:hypothetical protein